MRVRIKDIAERAGVSAGTVDRVIHDRGQVSVETRQKVTGILNEMHYEPDILASTLASRHPLKVALLIPYHTRENWFWKEPLTGINDAIAELGHFRIELKPFLYDQFSKPDFIGQSNRALSYLPDAVIAAPVFHHETQEFIGKCVERKIPFVSFNDSTGHPGQLAYIGQDAKQSGRVAAQLLKMAVPAGSRVMVISIAKERDNYRHILLREEGFSEYWRENVAIPQTGILKHAIPDESYGAIRNSLNAIFRETPCVNGIFATNSRVYQVARYLRDTSREKTMLVGYDLIEPNIRYLNEGVIDFLINQKPREQGYQALLTVFNKLRMNKKPMPERLIPIDIICKQNLCCYQV